MNIPNPTIERLSIYRRMLKGLLAAGLKNVASHSLAESLNLGSATIRRDLMLIGYTNPSKKNGYNIYELEQHISKYIDAEDKMKICIIGLGKLGRAILSYFMDQNSPLKIVAAFDIDKHKINKRHEGILCYHMDELIEIINEKDIQIAILAVPKANAEETAKLLSISKIQGILNYTSVHIQVNEDIYVENYDMVSSLEKVAFYVKSTTKFKLKSF